MEKLTKRDIQAQNTKARIMEVAIKLIKENRLESVKILDICESANVSVGTFYHYFKSKEDIIENAYANVDLSIKEKVEDRKHTTYREKILIIFEEANTNITNLGYKFMSDMLSFDLSNSKKFSIENSRYPYHAISNEIKAGIKAGEFKEGIDSMIATHDFMRIGRGVVVDWCLHEGAFDLVSDSQKIVGTYLDYISK